MHPAIKSISSSNHKTSEIGPSFTVSRHDASVIEKIARRAMGLDTARRNDPWTKQDAMMDVTATHANGNPLRLEAFLEADDFNFAHDFLGIRRHLDRETGKLGDFFSPRFSQR